MTRSEMLRADSLTCAQCIALASEYADEPMPPVDAVRFQTHIAQCASCARYHRVLMKGLTLVRETPEIQPSSDFVIELHKRLRVVDDEMLARQRSVTAGVTVVLAVAGLVALAAWSPLLVRNAATAPAVTAAAPAVETVGPAESLPVSDAWPADPWDVWFGPRTAGTRLFDVHELNATIPGPYSPLIIEPPAVGGRRAVLATYGNE